MNARGGTPRHQLGLGPTTLQAERRTPASRWHVAHSCHCVVLRLLTEYRHKRFFRPRCTVPGVRFATAQNTFVQRVSLSIRHKQLRSASSFAAGPPQHSTLWLVVRCSRKSYSLKERSSPRRRCPRDQRFARVLLPSHLCAQAASHSTADKCRHDCCARVPANLHQQTPEPLTLCPYPNPSLFIAPARYIPKHKYKPLTVHSTVHTDSTVSP